MSDASIPETPETSVVAEAVRFSFRGQPRDAYLALPEGAGPFPGVVVIHEVYGLNDNIRDVARRFAAAGYAALAVDLFAGRNRAVCMARFLGQMLSGSTNNSSIDELKAGLDWLGAAARSGCEPHRRYRFLHGRHIRHRLGVRRPAPPGDRAVLCAESAPARGDKAHVPRRRFLPRQGLHHRARPQARRRADRRERAARHQNLPQHPALIFQRSGIDPRSLPPAPTPGRAL